MNAKHGPYLVLDKGRGDKVRKSSAITVRLPPQLRSELDRVTSVGPYRMSITSIIERGIVLAVAELDDLAKRLK